MSGTRTRDNGSGLSFNYDFLPTDAYTGLRRSNVANGYGREKNNPEKWPSVGITVKIKNKVYTVYTFEFTFDGPSIPSVEYVKRYNGYYAGWGNIENLDPGNYIVYEYGYPSWVDHNSQKFQDELPQINDAIKRLCDDKGIEIPYVIESFSVNSITDVSTPGFVGKQKRGQVINNPMSSQKVDSTFNSKASQLELTSIEGYKMSGAQSYRGGTADKAIAACQFTPTIRYVVSAGQAVSDDVPSLLESLSLPPDDYASIVQSAINMAYGNMTNADIDLSVIYAERQSTLNMVANRSRKLVSLVSDLKRGNWAKLAPRTFNKYVKSGKVPYKDISKGLSSAWLEARYGWVPLINDLNGAIKAWKRTDFYPRQTFRGYDSSDSQDSFAGYTEQGSYLEVDVVTNLSVRAGVLCQVNLPLANAESLGLLTWTNTVWELIPYSFVVDWFIDVSSLLRISSNAIFEPISSWYRVDTVTSISGTCTYQSYAPTPISWESKIRSRVPKAEPTYINLNINLNYTRLIDSIALLTQIR